MQRLKNLLSEFSHIELSKFTVVGFMALVVEISLYNGLAIYTPLSTKPASTKIISGLVAIVIAFIANREWTFQGRSGHFGHDIIRYIITAGLGLIIATSILWFGYHILNQKTLLAQNIYGNILGTGVATIVRYILISKWVFPKHRLEN